MSRLYEDSADLRLFRRLKAQGLSTKDAAESVEMVTGAKINNPRSQYHFSDDWGYESSSKHELPHYHGNRRF